MFIKNKKNRIRVAIKNEIPIKSKNKGEIKIPIINLILTKKLYLVFLFLISSVVKISKFSKYTLLSLLLFLYSKYTFIIYKCKNFIKSHKKNYI